MSGSPRVALVVPTLGRRPQLLEQALESIEQQPFPVRVVIVAPSSAEHLRDVASRFGASLLPDPGGLVASINAGIQEYLTDPYIEFVGWLNDDDLLEPRSMGAVVQALDDKADAVAAFGACRYIDENGKELFVSKAGRWAPWILPWGPDLIPQPGMLIRAWAWRQIGGLDPSYRLAFDLDLLLRIKTLGRLHYAGTIVSSFRWHSESLTVDGRQQNLVESEEAKRQALPPVLRPVAPVWEIPVRWTIAAAAARVNRRARTSTDAG